MNRDRGDWCGRAVTVVWCMWVEVEVTAMFSYGGGCK